MRGAETVAKASQDIIQSDQRTWIKIYYDYAADRVMTEDDYRSLHDKSSAYAVTELIRPNTEAEIADAVRKWNYL